MFWLPIVANTLFQAPAHRLYWRLKKISYRACLLFYYLFGDKKQLLRALLTCTFIRLLLNFFDLRSYSSKSSRIYTFRLLLLVRLYMLREGIFYFLVRHWDEVFRKVLSLVSLNSQLLAKMLNFIFIKVTCKLRYLR